MRFQVRRGKIAERNQAQHPKQGARHDNDQSLDGQQHENHARTRPYRAQNRQFAPALAQPGQHDGNKTAKADRHHQRGNN